MKPYYRLKRVLKLVRWEWRRWQAARRWGRDALARSPVVVGNAMAKAGSHLLIQVLEGLVEIGPFVNPGFPPLNRFEDNSPLPEEVIIAGIRRLRSGDIAYGYLPARTPYLELFAEPGRAMVFIYRDPRDLLVSHVFYATEMYPGHGMHRYYTEHLSTMEERLNAAIRGVDEPGFELGSVRQRIESYIGWLDQERVHCVRFEDLIERRDWTLNRLLDYLAGMGFEPSVPREQAVAVLKRAIQPRRSGTFRKGKPGGWREHFTEANKALFKEVAGDLLIRLGYEEDNAW